MATAELQQNGELIGLAMDKEEAGYLLDLLHGHVAGDLAHGTGALARVRVALQGARVERRHAYAARTGLSYAALFTTAAQADNSSRAVDEHLPEARRPEARRRA